ncbi:hypothetical protein TNCV_518981 [Trichonephila clavipes]|nr:hypothetical protein TNCV_518981 [Trichonephila clavipes]
MGKNCFREQEPMRIKAVIRCCVRVSEGIQPKHTDDAKRITITKKECPFAATHNYSIASPVQFSFKLFEAIQTRILISSTTTHCVITQWKGLETVDRSKVRLEATLY